MKKVKEYYICDRCKKEIGEDDFRGVCSNLYFYDLCKNCKEDFDKYQSETKELEQKYDEIMKKYQFEKYLPREESK